MDAFERMSDDNHSLARCGRCRVSASAPIKAQLSKVREIAQDRGVEFFFAQFVDLYGRPSAKLVPAANLDSLVEDGAGFAGFAAGEIGQVPSDPDIAAIPDLDSLTLIPWERNLARFACDVTSKASRGRTARARFSATKWLARTPWATSSSSEWSSSTS